MVITQTTHVSLCSGYGGIDLGLRRVLTNLRTIACAEIEAFACELLLSRMENGQLDPAPIWSDLKSFPWAEFSGLVDILSGGYPCQPFSAAGKRLGAEDPRHLWPYIANGIRLLRPRVCFLENVEGHISLGLSTVISDLEELGYKVSWGIFSASECLDASGFTAPHQRKRVFICAVADSIPEGLQRCLRESSNARRLQQQTGRGSDCIWPSRPGEQQHCWEPPRVVGNVGNSSSKRREESECDERDQQQPSRVGEISGARGSEEVVGNASSAGWSQHCSGLNNTQNAASPVNEIPNERQIESSLGGDIDGPSSGLDYAELCVTCDNRTDELRLLGNGVVPATAAKAFSTLIHQL